MVVRQQIPGIQIRVPVLEAPTVQRVDVSSGIYAAADAAREIENAQKMRQLNDAQIGAAKAFRELNETNRRLPWEEKVKSFEEGAKAIRATYLDGLSDNEVKQLFTNDFERMYGSYQVHTKDDAFQGERAHAIATADEASDGFARDMAFARTPQERAFAQENMVKSWQNLVAGGFIDEVTARDKVSRGLAANDLYSAREQISRDPYAARKALAQPDSFKFLDPLQITSLRDEADREVKSRESEARARQAMVRQEALFSLQQWAQDNAASIQETGKAVDPPYSDAEMKSFLSPRQYEAMKRDQQQASALFQATGNMALQSPAEMQKTVEALKPVPGQQNYADQSKVYAAALRLKEQTEAARKADPGLAVRMAVPEVRGAWQAFEQSQKPEDLRAALKQSQLAQEALGVPKANQSLMPHQLAKSMAGQVNGAKPEEAAKILRSTAETFGPYWPQAFKQMSKLLDANMRVAATVDDPQAAALLVEGSRQSVTALRKAVGVKDNDTGIGQAVASDDRVISLATSLSQRAGGSGTATQVQASIELLALQRMRSFGEDQATATEAAIKRVVGDKYAFGGSGGFGRAASRSYRIPKQAGDPDQINRATLRIQSTLPVQDLDLPRDVPGSLKKYTAETYVNAVRREGYWVTNDDESGVILYAGNVPVTVGGKPVERTWSELKEVEVPRVGPKAPKPLRPVWPFKGDGQ